MLWKFGSLKTPSITLWRECGHGWTSKAHNPRRSDTRSMNPTLCCMSISLSGPKQTHSLEHSAVRFCPSLKTAAALTLMNGKLALTLVLAVGVLLSFIDMAYQRHTTGYVDHKAAFRWFWRTLISAGLLFFFVFGLYQNAFSND